MNVEPIAPYIAPLLKSVHVPRGVADAFDLFTAGISRWWPLRSYSISQDRAVSCAIDGRVGGELYEVRDDGERYPWGRVVVWDPPRRFVVTWHPGQPASEAQEVEVRFTPVGDGTLVELEHRNWRALGEKAAAVRDRYATGWDTVFGQGFGEAARQLEGRNSGGAQ